jgi:hypothetical protein
MALVVSITFIYKRGMRKTLWRRRNLNEALIEFVPWENGEGLGYRSERDQLALGVSEGMNLRGEGLRICKMRLVLISTIYLRLPFKYFQKG